MLGQRWMALVLAAGAVVAPPSARAQGGPDPAERIAAQQAALTTLAAMDGSWRGQATIVLPSGETQVITQTERVGPFLDGSVKVIEGRGYDADGGVAFNAFAILSYDPDARAFALRSYAQGRVGDFALRPTDDGYVWEIPAGPQTIRYTTVIRDGTWHEVGDRIAPGREPVRFLEMTLKRVGDTDWPGAGAIGPR